MREGPKGEGLLPRSLLAGELELRAVPRGNPAFEFTVFLLDNPKLKLEPRERNLEIERRR